MTAGPALIVRANTRRRAEILAWLQGKGLVTGGEIRRWASGKWGSDPRRTEADLRALADSGQVQRVAVASHGGRLSFCLPTEPPPTPQVAPPCSPYQRIADALCAEPDRAWSTGELASVGRCAPRVARLVLDRLYREGVVDQAGWRLAPGVAP